MQFDTSKYLKHLPLANFGSNVLFLEETPSTNDEVWNHIHDNDHIIVVTEKQTHGRGRRNNPWFSLEQKSLTFSVGVKLEKSNNKLIPFIVALSICKAINKLSSINVGIKWPNDIIINKKKIAGILIESKLDKLNKIFNIGIGVNVNLNEGDMNNGTIQNISSILVESNKSLSRENLLSEIIISFNKYLLKDRNEIIKLWLKNCVHVNMKVQFHNKNKIIEGVFKSVDSNGNALVNVDNNIESFSSGVLEL